MQENSDLIIEQLNAEILKQNQQIAELNAKLKWYEEQFRLSRAKQFGASSEKTTPEQINLFNEAEDSANPELEEPTVKRSHISARKSRPVREKTSLRTCRLKLSNTVLKNTSKSVHAVRVPCMR